MAPTHPRPDLSLLMLCVDCGKTVQVSRHGNCQTCGSGSVLRADRAYMLRRKHRPMRGERFTRRAS